MTEPLPDFTGLPDLASRQLGGSVMAANDELFAEKENLIKPEAPVFAAGEFGNRGKVYDGWETRRRREPGHDHAVVRLGVPGIVHGVVVDTSFFRGNFPPQVSVEALGAEGYPSPGELAEMTWHTLVSRTDACGDAVNAYPVADRRRWTHVRLSIYPDGGVARFRVHGTALPDPRFLAGTVDLAGVEHGGRVIGCSDAFYSSAGNLILPGRAAGMGEGWENARRRGPGHDYVVVALAAAGELRHAEIDTSWFVGNASGWIRLLAADARKAPPGWLPDAAPLLPDAAPPLPDFGPPEYGAPEPRLPDSASLDPASLDPASLEPGPADPASPEPGPADSASPEPGSPDPASPEPGSPDPASREPGLPWREVLPRTRLQPDTRHRFLIAGSPVATHVRLDVIPDGGLARLRINGEIVPEALADLRQRWWDALPEPQREHIRPGGG